MKKRDRMETAKRISAWRKEREKARNVERLNERAASALEATMTGTEIIDVDRDRPTSVWSSIRDEEVDAGKERGGSGGNPAAAGVSAMSENGTPEEGLRQGDAAEEARDDSEIVEPPPLDKGDRQPPPLKVLRPEQTAEYTLSRLHPKMRDYAIVGDEAWDVACGAAPADWAWEGVAENDGHVEIAGPTYSGKTTLAFLLAVASASTVGPVEVLGRKVIPVPRGKAVLIVEEENGMRSCRTKLRAACQMLGLDPRVTIARVVTLCRTGFCPGSEIAEIVRGDAARGCYGRIFLDSRARIFFENKANSEEDQASASKWVGDLINRAGCSVWIISHTRKGRANDLDDVSGSQQRAAAADVVLLVTSKKSKQGKVLSSRLGYKKIRNESEEDDDHPKAVTFSIGRDEKKRWRLTYKELDDQDLEAGPDAPLADRIVSLLREDGGGFSLTRIKDALHAGPPKVKAALAELVEKKLIVEYTTGRCPLYKLRPDGHFDSFDELVEKGENEDEDE